MSVTSRFTDAFDSKNKEHVLWLKKFFEFGKSMSNIESFIHTNPMGVQLSRDEMIQWVHIHFALAMKYSRDVLESRAWVPEQSV